MNHDEEISWEIDREFTYEEIEAINQEIEEALQIDFVLERLIELLTMPYDADENES